MKLSRRQLDYLKKIPNLDRNRIEVGIGENGLPILLLPENRAVYPDGREELFKGYVRNIKPLNEYLKT